jgi:hypothetical protein
MRPRSYQVGPRCQPLAARPFAVFWLLKYNACAIWDNEQKRKSLDS